MFKFKKIDLLTKNDKIHNKSSIKIAMSSNCFFFIKKTILYILFVIQSVYTDIISPSVYTDRITDGIVSIGSYHHNLLTEIFIL